MTSCFLGSGVGKITVKLNRWNRVGELASEAEWDFVRSSVSC